MRKVFGKIHLWLSIPAGILFSLICITGAMLVFATEISEAVHPERYFVERAQGKPIPLNELVPKVNTQLGGNSVNNVQIPSDPKRNYVMGLENGKRVSAYVDPYTGNVIEIYSYMDSFFGKVMALHRWLLFGAKDLGRNIVGYITLLVVLILISGIVIWWPKTKSQMKNRLVISSKKGSKRLFYDLHSSLGIYLVIGLLVLALTGLNWSFEWYKHGFYAIFGAKVEQKGEEKGTKQEGKPIDYSQWEAALGNVKQKVSEYKSMTISDGNVSVAPLSRYGNEVRADKYTIDPASGAITKVKLYCDAKKSNKIRGWIYSVHVGSWGGPATKILTLLTALLGGTLPLTGYYIYYLKRKRKWKKNPIV